MGYPETEVVQPYISKITLEPTTAEKNIRVTITVYMNNTKVGPMTETMQLSIVKIADKDIIKKLKLNNKKAIFELIENSKNDGSLGKISLSKAEVKTFDLGSKNTVTQEFFIDKNTSDLSFYAICQYNPNHPRHARRISSSPSYKNLLINTATIASEDVFRNKTIVRNANVFVFRDSTVTLPKGQEDYLVSQGGKRVWTGPVQFTSDGHVGSMGDNSSVIGPKLNLVKIPNTTLHDYRVLDKISKVNFSCRLLENKPLIDKKNAQFSNLCITNDKNGFIRLFFAIDLGEISKNNFKLPRLVASETDFSLALDSSKLSFDEIMSLSEIKNIVLTREKVNEAGDISPESKSHNNVQQTIARSTQVGAVVATTDYSVKKDPHIANHISNVKKIIGKLTEVKGLYLEPSTSTFNNLNSSKQIRYFGSTDISMQDIKDGLFKYGVKLEVEDGTIKYIKQLLNDLTEGRKAMELYFKDFKSGTLRKNYMVNDKGPWVWALNILLKAVKAFANLENNDEQQMYILSSPNTATTESISKVIDIYNNVSSFIQDLVEEFPSKNTRNIDEMNSNAVISGKKTFTQTISINHVFPDIFNAKNNGEVGYDYLDVTYGSKTSEIGLMTFSSADFLRRTMNENLRFFKQSAQQTGILAGNKRYENQLSTTQFSYLTPALIKILGRNFRTYGKGDQGQIQNASELGHFSVLMDLYSHKTMNRLHKENISTLAEVGKSQSNSCTTGDIFAQKSDGFSTHVKNGLAQNMAIINTTALKKYESSCNEIPSKEENTIAKLMHNSVAEKYKKEIQAKDDREDRINITEETKINPSFIFAPLFYMNNLDIAKEICCCSTALNLNISKQNLSTSEFKFLPNQLKAIAASSAGSTLTKQAWYDNGEPQLKQLKNAAFYYLNQKNIVLIEVLVGFDRGAIAAPIWTRLRRDHLENASRSPNKKLLCRLSPYTNPKLCFNQNRVLDLNLFNQCFLINAEGTPRTAARRPKRTIRPVEVPTSLDNNSLLKINSNFVRTNMMFGEAAKFRQTSKTKTTQTTAAITTATTPGTVTTTGGGMSSGGGRTY